MGTVPEYGMSRHAMTEWRIRQPRVMQCSYCGGGCYEGEKCSGCGGTTFLRPIEMPQWVRGKLQSHPK